MTIIDIHYINKIDFIEFYINARTRAYTKTNTRAEFRVAEFISFNSSEVLDKFDIHIYTFVVSSSFSNQNSELN